MRYPTLEEVNSANRYQICRWYRFLPSPGLNAITNCDYTSQSSIENKDKIFEKEVKIMDRIAKRLQEFGGFTPEISKTLGFFN